MDRGSLFRERERERVELTRKGLTRGAGSLVWNGSTVVRAWRAVKTHGQWAGMRLHRTSAGGKLVKEHLSLRVADFVWTRVLKSQGHSDSDGFLSLRETAVLVSCCVGEAGPLPLSAHAHLK